MTTLQRYWAAFIARRCGHFDEATRYDSYAVHHHLAQDRVHDRPENPLATNLVQRCDVDYAFAILVGGYDDRIAPEPAPAHQEPRDE